MEITYASAVIDFCKNLPANSPFRFGRYKVFIAALDPSKATASLLIEAHRAGKLRLTRADLTPAMAAEMVKKSEVTYLNACFHFVDLEGF